MRIWNFISLVGAAACLLSCASASYSGRGPATLDEKIVRKFAPPSLPSDLAGTVKEVLEISEPGSGILSPNGRTLYFTWDVSGTRQVWKVDGPLEAPVQLTSGNDATAIFDVTPQEGKYLIITRDQDGQENPGLFLLPTGGGALIEVLHKKGVRARPVWIANDADTLYYTANDIRPDSYALYSYSITTGQRELLFSEPGLWFVADVQGDTRFLLARMTGARSREYFLFSSETRQLTPVIGQGETEEYYVAFSKSDSYFVLTPKFGEFRRLYTLTDGQLSPITPDVKHDVESFQIDHRHAFLYLQWNRGGYSKLEVRDAQTLEIVPISGAPLAQAEQVTASNPSRFGRYVAISTETSTAPKTHFIYDWKEKKLTRWLKPVALGPALPQFQKPSLESYPARDGARIPMWVTRPSSCRMTPCPVIVHFHGGPEIQSRPGFNRLAQIFVGAGYVFVEPNVRGSEGYGRHYRDADNGAKRLDVITDIEDAAIYIRETWKQNGVAPRLGAFGGSYGGYSVLLAMSKFAGRFDAGVSIVGMSNLVTFLQNTASYRTLLRTTEYGDPVKDHAVLEKLSPISYVNQVRDPLLIMQGVNDPRVPVGEALQMHEALTARGVDSPLILFANEGHGAARRDDRILQYGHALKFFNEHLLKGVP